MRGLCNKNTFEQNLTTNLMTFVKAELTLMCRYSPCDLSQWPDLVWILEIGWDGMDLCNWCCSPNHGL
jgi:hypothetical protein